MKKFLSAIAVGVFLTSSITGFAAGIDSIEITDIPNNETTKKVIVTGTVPADKDVSLKVYKKGKTSANLANEALNAVLYYGSQKKATSQAQENITFDFPMSGEKGAYMIEINYAGSTSSDKLSEIFVYLPETDELEFIGALNNMHKTAEETVTDEELAAFANIIKDFVDNQYLIMPDNYAELSQDENKINAVFKIMMYDEDYTQIEDVPAAFTVAYNVSKLGSVANTEAIETLLKEDSEFVEQLGLKDTEALDVYLDTNYVFDRSQAATVLAGDNVVNSQTAKEAFENKVVALAVGAQTKYTIMDILEALNSYLSLDFTKYDALTAKQEAFREYLSGNMPIEPTIDQIKSYYQDAVTNVLDKQGPTSTDSYRPSSDSNSKNDSLFEGASVVVIPQVTVPESVTRTASFADLGGYEWAADDIVYLYENNYIDGTSATTFNPASMVKREEYLKMLVNAANITGNKTTTEFSDVVNGAWYEKFVALGVENGIVNGQSEDNFGIGMNVTREDMAVMMYRVLKDRISMSAEGAESFKDFDSISEYAKEAVACMQNLGIINGMDDGSFCPKDNATRAQAAVCIRRMLKYIE